MSVTSKFEPRSTYPALLRHASAHSTLCAVQTYRVKAVMPELRADLVGQVQATPVDVSVARSVCSDHLPVFGFLKLIAMNRVIEVVGEVGAQI